MNIATGQFDDDDETIPLVDVPAEARSPDAVVRFLLERCTDVGPVDRAFDAWRHRESLGSTNVGHGVAIPQIVDADVGVATVLAGRLPAPIDWPGGERVRLVCLVLAPNHDATLSWMETIARYLKQADGQSVK